MPFPARNPYAAAELHLPDAIPDDDRLGVPTAPGIAYRPLFLSASQGFWMTMARIQTFGIVSRHTHPAPVHGYVIKGQWRYLEHAWVARAGAYVYEPPGDTHTLVVDAEGGEMMTLFQVHGAMIYMDETGQVTGHDDVFTRIDQCRRHFATVGLGEDYVERFIR
jgi:2,4'-dihydroxyacetophenone dioxygenase